MPDVCIAGGGPAGAALALRLAQLGRSVAIVEKAQFPRTHIGESLTGGVMPLLATLGLLDEVEGAGFIASHWASVDWADGFKRYRVHGGPGLQVDRGQFDSLLLKAACSMPGVSVYQPAKISDYIYTDGRWRIQLDTGQTIDANYLADAAGRARILGGQKRRIGVPTLAMYSYWRGAADCEEGDTLVEAGPAAWFWGAPLPDGTFNAAVFVDPCVRSGYFELLRESKLLWPRVRGARLCGEPLICDATPYADQTPVTLTSIKAGDAAISIDPLSSQGVQTAIGTALHAAVVLNTMIARPEDAELAMEFYRSRLADSAEFHSAAASRFYCERYEAGGGEFWRRRADAAKHSNPLPQRAQLLAMPAPETIVRLSPQVRFASLAVVDGHYVRRQAGVKLGPKTFGFIADGRAAASLLQAIDRPLSAIKVIQRWSCTMPPAEALQILKWAWAERLIESAEYGDTGSSVLQRSAAIP